MGRAKPREIVILNNPSGTTHSHEVPGDKLETQMIILDDLKELLTDTAKKNKKAFITCGDGRHDYHPVTERTIPANTVSGKSIKVSHYFADGLIHYWEKCNNDNCGKLRMGCSKEDKGNV